MKEASEQKSASVARPFMTEKNESYELGLGLTTEQKVYYREWRRSRPVSGGTPRPWSSLGFKAVPGRVATLTLDDRFVPGNLVDVVALRSPAELPQLTEERRRFAFPALVQSGGLSPDGSMNVDYVQRTLDFSSWPLQDYHRCTPEQGEVGEIRAFKRHPVQKDYNEPVTVQMSELWIDICVGVEKGKPVLAYRFPRAEAEECENGKPALEIVKQSYVRAPGVLAIMHRPFRYFKARFESDGSIHWFRVGKFRASASQKIGLFRMLNRMMREQNDMIFLPVKERPMILTPELQPRVKIAFSIQEASNLLDICDHKGNRLWHATPYLQNLIRQAIGIRNASNGYHITSEHTGQLVGFEEAKSEHLKQLIFSVDGVTKRQLVPVTAVLLDTIKPGDKVTIDQPIADICERHMFNTWQEVEDVLGPNRDYFLVPDFLARQLIWPGQQGWNGQTVLLDYEIAEPLCQFNPEVGEAPRQWVWDFGPCRAFYDHDCEGYVLPPIHTPDNDDLIVGPFAGVHYNLATEWEDPSNALGEEPTVLTLGNATMNLK